LYRYSAAEAERAGKLNNYEQVRVEFAALGEPWRAMQASPSSSLTSLPTSGAGKDSGGGGGGEGGSVFGGEKPSSSAGMWIPRLVHLHEDPSMSERIQYVLREGRTRVGAASTSDVAGMYSCCIQLTQKHQLMTASEAHVTNRVTRE
jgi:hypothetical protein